jgi:hypothetical protein
LAGVDVQVRLKRGLWWKQLDTSLTLGDSNVHTGDHLLVRVVVRLLEDARGACGAHGGIQAQVSAIAAAAAADLAGACAGARSSARASGDVDAGVRTCVPKTASQTDARYTEVRTADCILLETSSPPHHTTYALMKMPPAPPTPAVFLSLSPLKHSLPVQRESFVDEEGNGTENSGSVTGHGTVRMRKLTTALLLAMGRARIPRLSPELWTKHILCLC